MVLQEPWVTAALVVLSPLLYHSPHLSTYIWFPLNLFLYLPLSFILLFPSFSLLVPKTGTNQYKLTSVEKRHSWRNAQRPWLDTELWWHFGTSVHLAWWLIQRRVMPSLESMPGNTGHPSRKANASQHIHPRQPRIISPPKASLVKPLYYEGSCSTSRNYGSMQSLNTQMQNRSRAHNSAVMRPHHYPVSHCVTFCLRTHEKKTCQMTRETESINLRLFLYFIYLVLLFHTGWMECQSDTHAKCKWGFQLVHLIKLASGETRPLNCGLGIIDEAMVLFSRTWGEADPENRHLLHFPCIFFLFRTQVYILATGQKVHLWLTTAWSLQPKHQMPSGHNAKGHFSCVPYLSLRV